MNASQDITALFQEGVTAINRKDYQAAKGHFKAVLAAVPDNPEALSFLGFAEAAMGNVEGGLEKTTRARGANPGNPQNLINHAYALSEAGRAEEAIADLKEAHRLAPDEIIIANQLSRLLFEAERFGEVEGITRDLFEKTPKDPLVANRLVIALVRNGKGDEAYEVAQKLRNRFGENPFVWGMVARAARAAEKVEVAIENFQKLVTHDPDDVRSLKALSHCLMKMEMFNEAVPVLQQVLKQEPDSAESLYSVGFALHNINRAEEGLPFIERSLVLEPDNPEALLIKGHYHVYLGEYDEAKKAYDKVLELDSNNAEAYLKLIKMDPPKEKNNTFTILESIAENRDLPFRKQIVANFTLGEMYENLKDWDTAFKHFDEGNKLSLKAYEQIPQWVYESSQSEQQFANLKRVYSREMFAGLDHEGSQARVPVFIFGMPRSGTTLLEQIIASHSKVLGAGELPFGNNIATHMASVMGDGFVSRMKEVFQQFGDEWAAKYLEFLPERQKGQEHVTDKMPNNFLHLGFLQVILPKASFIHIRRHPLDNCLSIYSKMFNKSFSYARDLYSLGHYYRQYVDLMEYWKTVLPRPLMEVGYEDLVINNKKLAPEILKFCGLEWEPGCLEFYKQKNKIKTMSTFQVRKPINKSSMEKWRRYEKHLGPLLEGLGEEIVATLNLDT